MILSWVLQYVAFQRLVTFFKNNTHNSGTLLPTEEKGVGVEERINIHYSRVGQWGWSAGSVHMVSMILADGIREEQKEGERSTKDKKMWENLLFRISNRKTIENFGVAVTDVKCQQNNLQCTRASSVIQKATGRLYRPWQHKKAEIPLEWI